jgi:sulfatase modifying factor 1
MKTRILMILVVGVLFVASIASAVTIEWVTVGNPGNADDDTGYGGVSDEYQISTYEVTAGQYTEFLNTVAATDTYGLYNTSMDSSGFGCKIQRSGSSGSYTYSVASDYADRPVNYVSWYDCLRFANWLHNGQPTGSQDATTTEDGAYDMSLGSSVVRKAGAWIWLPSEDEWYKAAYHKNDGVTGNYFDYPASSDTAPGRDALETTNPGNNANYYDGGYLIGSPYYRTVIGEFELSDSPYGTFDMGGNVWEWNETVIGSYRGIRGGSYGDSDLYLRSSYRNSDNPYYAVYYIGFRVASVPVACPSADLTNDCFVNFEDLAQLAAQWLTGRQ